jgi:hypothetical protein
VRGEEYFVGMEITTSLKKKNRNKKFRMSDFFRDTLLPKLDMKAEELSRELNKNIIVRYQHDNASPHVEKHFKQFLEQQGWLIGYQPPCSPTTNVNDAYLFHALSKIVSRSQAINFKARTLSTEELWMLAKEAFETYPLEKLSMAFIQNKQVMCAILEEDNGGNEHTKEKTAMHFNMHKTCIPWYADEGEEGDRAPNEDESGNVRVRRAIGVHMIEEYETDELPTFKQGQTLKYPRSDTSQYDTDDIKTYLTKDELDFIYN